MGALATLAALLGVGLFGLVLYEDWTCTERDADAAEPADALVVYNSRSGHTATPPGAPRCPWMARATA